MSARSVRCWPWVNPNPWCRSGGTSKATMTASAVSGSMERTRRGWKMGLMSVTKKGRFTRACNARRVRGSPGTGTAPCRPWRRRRTGTASAGCRSADRLVSRPRSSVGLRWPSKRIAALHRLPIRYVLAARCALRYAPMAARSLRDLIGDATLALVSEIVPAKSRGRYVAILEGFWPLGFIAAGVGAYLCLPSIGWRGIFIALAVPAVFVFVVRRFVPESPRWLEDAGRFSEADAVT